MRSSVQEREFILKKKKQQLKGSIGKNKMDLTIVEKRGYRIESIDNERSMKRGSLLSSYDFTQSR